MFSLPHAALQDIWHPRYSKRAAMESQCKQKIRLDAQVFFTIDKSKLTATHTYQ